ncbi:MAG: histone deacetylase [Candidatus Acetothermia bacterium]|jgi:acetoin utilization deacetylase AcuC-like enzyme|nr:histone deacetylase [Candidatus Acetothermia bacterium]MDH7505499.1 histone deacetylase [Candidatus Acetothermia bacterium]
MKIVYSERCLEFAEPGHPESPERVCRAAEYLRGRYEFVEPEPASEEDLLLVHTPKLVASVKSLSFFDYDSPAYPGIYDYARLAAGGALRASEVRGFSLMRPPGHHAGRDFLGGFCYFNNIAVAVRRSGRKTLILDIDGHHGNGTEDIFLGDPQVVYVSLHRAPLYPGTGLSSVGNCLNFPLPARCGDAIYLGTLDDALHEALSRDFRPEQVALSVGLDGYREDPLASLGLSTEAYREIGKRIGSLGRPVFAVLEGGYVPEALGPNIEALIQGLERR